MISTMKPIVHSSVTSSSSFVRSFSLLVSLLSASLFSLSLSSLAFMPKHTISSLTNNELTLFSGRRRRSSRVHQSGSYSSSSSSPSSSSFQLELHLARQVEDARVLARLTQVDDDDGQSFKIGDGRRHRCNGCKWQLKPTEQRAPHTKYSFLLAVFFVLLHLAIVVVVAAALADIKTKEH